jgi:hypothetical protein
MTCPHCSILAREFQAGKDIYVRDTLALRDELLALRAENERLKSRLDAALSRIRWFTAREAA